jgi:sugar (pentulose or hexulose) kinase
MTENRCLIGIDAGTSAVKAVAFDGEGNEFCVREAEPQLRRLERSCVEQDMNELWRTVKPSSLATAHVIFRAQDWLFFKLTGIVNSDETDESLTRLGMSTRKYDPELFRIFAIEDLYWDLRASILRRERMA